MVDGRLEGKGSVEGYIARDGIGIMKRRFSNEPIEGGDRSFSCYEALDAGENASLVLVTPITGRTHQIRLHMASLGHTIIGDTMYGKESADISRQALHAYSLSFPSPIDGKLITVKAPLPCDVLALLDKFSLKIGDNNEG